MQAGGMPSGPVLQPIPAPGITLQIFGKNYIWPPVSEDLCRPALSVSAGNGKIKRPLAGALDRCSLPPCFLWPVYKKVYKKYVFYK